MTQIDTLTAMMNIHERRINEINQAYSFKIETAPKNIQEEYAASLKRWDSLKAQRDQLKSITTK